MIKKIYVIKGGIANIFKVEVCIYYTTMLLQITTSYVKFFLNIV